MRVGQVPYDKKIELRLRLNLYKRESGNSANNFFWSYGFHYNSANARNPSSKRIFMDEWHHMYIFIYQIHGKPTAQNITYEEIGVCSPR